MHCDAYPWAVPESKRTFCTVLSRGALCVEPVLIQIYHDVGVGSDEDLIVLQGSILNRYIDNCNTSL